MACIKEVQSQLSYAVLQKFEYVSAGGINICNELDCPLVQPTDRFDVKFSTQVLGSISIVHECGISCKVEQNLKTIVEREESVISGAHCVKHDKKNDLYALNIYCINYYPVMYSNSLETNNS